MKQTASAQHQSGHSSSSSKQSAKGSKERPAQKANKINTCGSVEQSKNRTADAKKELMHLIDYFPNAAQRMTRSRKNESRRQRARIASSSSESPDGRVIATKSAGTKLVKARQMAVKTLAPFAIESINGHLPTVAQVQEALKKNCGIITYSSNFHQRGTPPKHQQKTRISEERVDMEQIQLNNLIEQVEGQRENLVEQQNEQQQQQDEQQQNAQQQQQNEQQQNAQHQQQNEQQQNAQQQQHQQNAQQQQQNEQQQNAQQQQQQQNEQQQNALQQNAQQQQQQQNEQQQNAPQGEQQQQRKKNVGV
uniref:Uncharacterized protein n=1 Tax=Globodera rostochiensis TaxID=31243 RepID=A0A914HS52_GLORO